ncbi:hypothetical protein [Streptomyces sp. NPDC020817]|uniref:hypothetical protein n=1 Tax=Streptomyces sp. NPDC020817 TaxID=3365095 RepID=UPI00379929A1
MRAFDAAVAVGAAPVGGGDLVLLLVLCGDHVGGEWFELSRPPHAPPDRRWETAIAEGVAPDSVHAFGSFETTLCGIELPGMSPSDYIWLPDRPGACSGCRKAALVIDERWPRELRDEHARTSMVKQLPK